MIQTVAHLRTAVQYEIDIRLAVIKQSREEYSEIVNALGMLDFEILEKYVGKINADLVFSDTLVESNLSEFPTDSK